MDIIFEKGSAVTLKIMSLSDWKCVVLSFLFKQFPFFICRKTLVSGSFNFV